jgi:hypothetical protein
MIPDAKTIKALCEALDDEYKARATYRKVIEAFGPIRPFVNIVEAEDRHAKALLALLRASRSSRHRTSGLIVSKPHAH